MIDRLRTFELLFDELMATNSINEKNLTIEYFKAEHPEYVDDLIYVLETISGQHPIGWTLESKSHNRQENMFASIKDMIEYCEKSPKNREYTDYVERILGDYADFLEPIVNRTLRLGINKSLLSKKSYTPMLAKKYEHKPIVNDIVITEKLDGNRCIAFYNNDEQKWCFKSRSGKDMNVSFDMSHMPKGQIYDGEVMSREQTTQTIARYSSIKESMTYAYINNNTFSATSGLINNKGTAKKDLCYNVFDIIAYLPYSGRRDYLENRCENSKDVFILPSLYSGRYDSDMIDKLLDKITSMGGEGVMINDITKPYEQKRSNALLKVKKVQTMDMRVFNLIPGTGKYIDCVGALQVEARLSDGRMVRCDVGTGLSDIQREAWAWDPVQIIGEIVEVGYHELSQPASMKGTDNYSLRFPRFIRVRDDKKETSEW